MNNHFKVSYTSKNVNSKRLFAEIMAVVLEISNEFISTGSVMRDKSFDFSDIIEFLGAFFAELAEKKTITPQFDLIADERNNDPLAVRSGLVNVTVKYTQYYCLNKTEINFQFSLK